MSSTVGTRGTVVGVATGRSLTRTQRCLGCLGHAGNIYGYH